MEVGELELAGRSENQPNQHKPGSDITNIGRQKVGDKVHSNLALNHACNDETTAWEQDVIDESYVGEDQEIMANVYTSDVNDTWKNKVQPGKLRKATNNPKHKNNNRQVKTKIKKSPVKRMVSSDSAGDVAGVGFDMADYDISGCNKRKRPKRKANNVSSYKENMCVSSPPCDFHISSHYTDIFQNLKTFQVEGMFCDIILKANEGSLSAHKLMLMAGSPYFHEKLEKMDRVGDDGIKCLDLSAFIPYWALKHIVGFIYTGKVQIPKSKLKEFSKYCTSLRLEELSEKINSKDDITSENTEMMETPKTKLPQTEIVNIRKTRQCRVQDEDKVLVNTTLLQTIDSKPESAGQKKETEKNIKMLQKSSTNKETKESEKSKTRNIKTSIKSKHVSKGKVSKTNMNLDNKYTEVKGKSKKPAIARESEIVSVVKSKQKKVVVNKKRLNDCSDQVKEKEEINLDDNELKREEMDMNTNLDDDIRNNVKSNTELKKVQKKLVASSLKQDADGESFLNKNIVLNDINSKSVGDTADSYNGSDIDDFKLLDNDTDYNSDTAGDAESDDAADDEPLSKKVKMNKTKVNSKADDKVPKSKDQKGIGKKKTHSETQCKRCEEHFPSKEELKNHRKVCKGNRPRRRCILCKISFETSEEYLHHRDTDVKCLEIRQQKHQKRLKRKAQLRTRFACRVCPRKFRRVADHIDHEYVAHDLPYEKEQWPDLYCEWCSYWTMNPWRLHHHKTYDCSKGQEYICDMCGNKYKNEKTLKCHVEMMHTDALPMLTCEQCGKTLKGPKGLEHHIRIMHKGENPHKRHMCHICSMKYTSNSDLIFHLHRVHDQPLPDAFVVYQCQQCDYVINNKRTYQKHMLLHDDKRDWKCDMCPKAFKTRNSLHTHMKSHIGKKMPCPYDECNYAALKKCHLKTHIENQHTQKGMKNEQCHMCSYSTFFKGNLIKHLRTVHQLEVVTRYSVQMKAKYKNLKTGQIVGALILGESQKNKKNSENKQDSGTKKSKPCTQTKPEESDALMASVDSLSMSESHYNVQMMSGDSHTVAQPLPQLEIQEVSSQKFDHHIIPHPSEMPVSLPHNLNPAYMYPMGSVSMTHTSPNLSNLNVIYCNPQDLSIAQQGGVSVQRGTNLLPPGNLVREVNMTLPNMYGGKVAGPGMFQPQGVDDEVTNAAKMLTYFQM